MADNIVATAPVQSIIKVSNTSEPKQLAGAISHALLANQEPVLRAIGAAAVNQAVKAIAIARGYVAVRGLDLSCRPGFENTPNTNGRVGASETISCMVFKVSTS